ncbi:MAG: hypothetical protein ACRCWI_08410 [Brevinema sp.]
MPLVATNLTLQLNALAKEDLSTEAANAKFAQIITDYLKTAQVVGSGQGSNGGGALVTTVTGTLQ